MAQAWDKNECGGSRSYMHDNGVVGVRNSFYKNYERKQSKRWPII